MSIIEGVSIEGDAFLMVFLIMLLYWLCSPSSVSVDVCAITVLVTVLAIAIVTRSVDVVHAL